MTRVLPVADHESETRQLLGGIGFLATDSLLNGVTRARLSATGKTRIPPELPIWTGTHGADGRDATTDQKVVSSNLAERGGVAVEFGLVEGVDRFRQGVIGPEKPRRPSRRRL